MPRQAKPLFNGWSYSRWSTYNQCPLKFKLMNIDKIKEEKSEALLNGIRVHNLADGFIKGTIKRLPKELKHFAEDFKHLKEQYEAGNVDAEQMLCFDKDWNFVKDKFSKEVWVRIKTDSTFLGDDGDIIIIDFKTGKVKEDGYIEQLELYVLSAFKVYEGIQEVSVELWFLDHDVVRPKKPLVFTPKDEKRLQKEWENRIKPMYKDRQFKATPNRYCGWCSYRKSNGGPCKHA